MPLNRPVCLPARIKLVECQVSVLVDVAAHVNARADFLIEVAAGKLVAGAHQFHLQVERRADRAFEVFCFGNRRGCRPEHDRVAATGEGCALAARLGRR